VIDAARPMTAFGARMVRLGLAGHSLAVYTVLGLAVRMAGRGSSAA